MGIGRTGKRIEKIRKSAGYSSVEDAISAMNKAGLDLTKNQLYALEGGQWPNRSQLIALCDFFDVSTGFLLLGDGGCCKYYGLFKGLSKEQHDAVERLIDHFNKENQKLSPPRSDN